MEFAPHQQRVIDERRDLTEKLHKLILFFDTPIFRNDLEEAERVRLREQKMFMTIYRNILTERINAFIRAMDGRSKHHASQTNRRVRPERRQILA